MALASTSFFVTFAIIRTLVHVFRGSQPPLEIWVAGIHLHHYVMGIGLLLAVGYLWLVQIGTGASEARGLGRVTALLYGIGAALTLDEFALWLHLDDVYWQPKGRVSIEAVILFGALVSIGVWGAPFFRAAGRQMGRVMRRRRAITAPSASGVAGEAVRQIEALLRADPEPLPASVEVVAERDADPLI